MTTFVSKGLYPYGDTPIDSGHLKQRVRAGDIRQVESLLGLNTEPRRALVVRVYRSPDYAEIMLIDDLPTPNLSGGFRLVGDETGLAYPIIVHPHLRGVVWEHQLTEFIARISRARLEQLVSDSFFPPANSPEFSGDTAETLADAEQADLYSELEALWALTGDCTDALMDDGPPWQIDIGLLSPSLLKKTHNRHELIAETHHFLNTRQAKVTVEDIHTLRDSGAFSVADWQRVVTDRSVAVLIVNSLASLASLPLNEPFRCERVDSGHQHPRVPERLSEADEIVISESARLITAPFLWGDEIEGFDECGVGGQDEAVGCPEIVMLATPNLEPTEKASVHHV